MEIEKEVLEPIIKESKQYSDVLRKLNWKECGSNRYKLKRLIYIYKIDISHFVRYAFITLQCSSCSKNFNLNLAYYNRRKSKGQKTFCCSKPCSNKVIGILCSQTQKGKHKIKSQSLKLKENAKINPNYGMRGKHHKLESCDKIAKKRIGTKLTDISKKKISEAISGENHHNWKGGISFLPYCSKFNNKLKEAVRNRDSYTCQLCGIKQSELTGKKKKLTVHHIHHDKDNCYPDLITLCDKCNVKVERKDKIKYYEELFMNNLNDRCLLFWTISFKNN